MAILIRHGKVTGYSFGTAIHGSKTVRFIQTLFGTRDVRKIQDAPHAGIDATPPKGSLVVTLESGETMRFAIASCDFISPESAEGEFEIYSSNGTTKKARVKCRQDGTIYIASKNNSENLAAILNELTNAVKTLAAGTCVSGSPLTTSAAAITALNTALTDISKLLSTIP